MSVEAGYAKRIINPPLPTSLTGYGIYLDRNATSVHDDLYLRIGLFRFENGSTFCVAGFDLIGFDAATIERIRRSIADAIDSKIDSVLVACTHTHSGPPSMLLRGMGEPNSDYLDSLIDSVGSAAIEAASRLGSSTLYFVKEPIEPIGFNRTSNDFHGIDPNLSILAAAPGGGIEGSIVLASYAVHPVVLGINKEVSADIPGALCRDLEARGAMPIFLQGFCGDIDPVSNLTNWGKGGYEETERYASHLSERVATLLGRAESIADPIIEFLTSNLSLPFDREGSLEKHIDLLRSAVAGAGEGAGEGAGKGLERFVAELRSDWSGFAKAGEHGESVELPVQMIRIRSSSRTIDFIALGAEVFASFSLFLASSRSRSITIPVGYANGNIGYIPDKAAFAREGDYAAHIAPFIYRLRPLQRDTASFLLRHLELTRKSGRFSS